MTYQELRQNSTACPQFVYTLTRTFTSTDACSNSAVATQLITVQATQVGRSKHSCSFPILASTSCSSLFFINRFSHLHFYLFPYFLPVFIFIFYYFCALL